MAIATPIATLTLRHALLNRADERPNCRHKNPRRRDFDLWVTYYGEHQPSLRSISDYFVPRSGTKFQNLHYCYSQWPELFAHYDAIMVMDDDIIIEIAPEVTGISPFFVGPNGRVP